MIIYPDGRIECTPPELVAYQRLLLQQTQQSQAEAESVMSIVGVTPALRFHLIEAINRYRRSMYP
jgi:hypothetical protein